MRKGFTLIELLVVIAVIAVLMGILMPALTSARKQGKQAYCQSSLRQIGMAAGLYAEDNGYFVPRDANNEDDPYIWFVAFMPYLAHDKDKEDYRDVKIYRCPAYPDKRQTVCYVVNGTEETDDQLRLINYRRLSEKIYLADNEDGPHRPIISSRTDDDVDKVDVWDKRQMPSSNHDDRRVARDRHRKGYNALYADWHVERLTVPSDLSNKEREEVIQKEFDMWLFRKQK